MLLWLKPNHYGFAKSEIPNICLYLFALSYIVLIFWKGGAADCVNSTFYQKGKNNVSMLLIHMTSYNVCIRNVGKFNHTCNTFCLVTFSSSNITRI